MGDSDKENQSSAPAWQQAQSTTEPSASTDSDKSRAVTLEQAKKFLQDADVQKQTRERKTAFLQSKGISASDIEKLLAGDDAPETQPTTEPQIGQPSTQLPQPTEEKRDDRPPIVTYPEFLTKPSRPPPLMTVNGFLNTLYAFGGLSALVYGTSRYVVQPMVDSLTEARIQLHDTTNDNLTKLIQKLESTVSEIPVTASKPVAHADVGERDDASSYDDPTELFHRDIGVQTSLPPSPRFGMTPTSPQHELAASEMQARRLTELVRRVRKVADGFVSQGENYESIKTNMDLFRDELDRLMYPQTTDFIGGYSLYGGSGSRNSNEPDDEMKKAKENIRRVKGLLLSTRNFPTSRAVS